MKVKLIQTPFRESPAGNLPKNAKFSGTKKYQPMVVEPL
jgi:hypothetical protein